MALETGNLGQINLAFVGDQEKVVPNGTVVSMPVQDTSFIVGPNDVGYPNQYDGGYANEPEYPAGIFGKYERMRDGLGFQIRQHKNLVRGTFWLLVLAGYIGYLVYALTLNFDRAQSLLWVTIAVILLVIYFNFFKVHTAVPAERIFKSIAITIKPQQSRMQITFFLAFLVAVAVFLGFDTYSSPERLRALAGVASVILLGVLFSQNPGRINWRIVVSGLGFQFVFGLIVLRWDSGKDAFTFAGNAIQRVLSFANNGSDFVFSPGENDHYMAFRVMPVLLFASFLISILYHIGAMGWFVEKIGWAIYIGLGTTACESISAAANVFLGMTEAPLTIKPYMNLLTLSELFAVMSGGFATISGGLMVTFAAMGIDAKNLLAASVMNAPSALVMAKLLVPEVHKSKTRFKDLKRDTGTAYNVLDAAMTAAGCAVQAISGILSMLICAIAFLALVDAFLSYMGGLVDLPNLSLAMISGYAFYPLAFLMGVDARECRIVGQLLGYKTFLNEFVAYTELQKIVKNDPTALSEKGQTIVTYALCGFANFSSVGIQLANFSVMAPGRKKDIVSIVLKALLAGFLANVLTASVAGLLIG
ncbi:hypothetical protein RvY_09026 [Ramazzottius varieornatus]|uniref:Sodium/nucleoside cotransporter n=1 Tax=Ramazzottius varieornatus TaxID=947166 RepID=A0A1D1VCI6_RAMVA|nr:hypothetical protein RvY_09026 [Ramazzottius varieornatus]